MERQLVADQSLWRRVPAGLGHVLWPLGVALLGWGTGWWAGAAAVAALGVASTLLPPRLRVSVYLVDALDRLLRLPLQLGWLVLVWHLWLREPLFPILGQPLVGALLAAAALWLSTRLLAFLSRFGASLAMGRR